MRNSASNWNCLCSQFRMSVCCRCERYESTKTCWCMSDVCNTNTIKSTQPSHCMFSFHSLWFFVANLHCTTTTALDWPYMRIWIWHYEFEIAGRILNIWIFFYMFRVKKCELHLNIRSYYKFKWFLHVFGTIRQTNALKRVRYKLYRDRDPIENTGINFILYYKGASIIFRTDFQRFSALLQISLNSNDEVLLFHL